MVDSELEKKKEAKSNKNSKHLLEAFFDGSKQSGDKISYMPQTAFEYTNICEPGLGIPPKIILDDCIEIPLYINDIQKRGVIRAKNQKIGANDDDN